MAVSRIITFADLHREYLEIQPEIQDAVCRVLESGLFVLGNEVLQFEKAFSRYLGVQWAIGVNSGSDALYLALKALDIGRGDEVITVAHTVVSTADAIVRCGADPVFVDISPDTYCIDVESVEAKITEKTKAIMPVHLYGHPANLKRILQLAKQYGLAVVEDACQAHGAEYKEKKVGSFGHLGCFSFYPTKNLGSYGDGGIIVTKDDELARKIKMLRNYGQSSKYSHDIVGVNSRLDELQAAILRVKLPRLDEGNEKRRRLAALYKELLEPANVTLPVEKGDAKHVYHLFVVRTSERDKLRRYLKRQGVQTQIHYPVPVHRQKAYKALGKAVHLPVTETVCDEILSLPLYPTLTVAEALHIGEVVKDAVG